MRNYDISAREARRARDRIQAAVRSGCYKDIGEDIQLYYNYLFGLYTIASGILQEERDTFSYADELEKERRRLSKELSALAALGRRAAMEQGE